MISERHKRWLYRTCDGMTEGLIYFAILFGPWAFGTTQPWSIKIMNGTGLALGLLWLGKFFIRVGGHQPLRWTNLSMTANGKDSRELRQLKLERRFTWLLGAGTICILLYCLVSAVNARASYEPDQWRFEYRNAVLWLPHSYDRDSSWAAFWEYAGLAGLFWALRDWLLTLSPKEAARFAQEGGESFSTVGTPRGDVRTAQRAVPTFTDHASGNRLPVRLRRLFWILAINGTVLAFQGLMQRAEGGNKLLWLVVPRLTNSSEQFGPYAYRANAAQYFNLLWPAVLGFWWAGASSLRRRKAAESSPRQGRVAVLLPCVLIMAICPLVTSSRGGAIVLAGSLLMAAGILLMAQSQRRWTTKASILVLLAGVVGGGALLGWKALAPRMEMIHEGYNGREGLYLAGRYMAQDNAWFGTGPGTFGTMYPLYRRAETDEWLAYMHNDWLETLITFGRVGATPIFLTLLLVLAHWFGGGGIHGNKYFVMLLWVALGGCLVHACFDFPFQIHSVLALFLVLCAVLSCLARRVPSGA